MGDGHADTREGEGGVQVGSIGAVLEEGVERGRGKDGGRTGERGRFDG